MRRSWIMASFIALLLLLLEVYWRSQDQNSSLGENNRVVHEEYDFYMENANSIHYDEQGKVSFRMQANRLTHYPDSNITTMTQPYFIIYEESGEPWHISARLGRIIPSKNGELEVVELKDAVEINKVTAKDKKIAIATEFLTINPKREFIETDQAVKISGDASITTAIGMKGDLKRQHIYLLSKVRTHYEQSNKL